MCFLSPRKLAGLFALGRSRVDIISSIESITPGTLISFEKIYLGRHWYENFLNFLACMVFLFTTYRNFHMCVSVCDPFYPLVKT